MKQKPTTTTKSSFNHSFISCHNQTSWVIWNSVPMSFVLCPFINQWHCGVRHPCPAPTVHWHAVFVKSHGHLFRLSSLALQYSQSIYNHSSVISCLSFLCQTSCISLANAFCLLPSLKYLHVSLFSIFPFSLLEVFGAHPPPSTLPTRYIQPSRSALRFALLTILAHEPDHVRSVLRTI
jgi:hypothetical protein